MRRHAALVPTPVLVVGLSSSFVTSAAATPPGPRVIPPTGVVALDTGRLSSCAIRHDGRLAGWADNT